MGDFTGDKNEIEHAALETLKKSGTGIYNLQIIDENNRLLKTDKLIIQ